MLKKYLSLPSGVMYPERRAKKLCDLLDFAIDEYEKKGMKLKKRHAHGDRDEKDELGGQRRSRGRRGYGEVVVGYRELDRQNSWGVEDMNKES